MKHGSMNLAHATTCANFVRMLEQAEKIDALTHQLTSWESDFVRSMRDQFDARQDQMDLGMTPWSPSVSQWNTLHEIAGQL